MSELIHFVLNISKKVLTTILSDFKSSTIIIPKRLTKNRKATGTKNKNICSYLDRIAE